MTSFNLDKYNKLKSELEISEINFLDARSIAGETRWDSEYYQKHFLKNQIALEKKQTIRFKELCNSIKKGVFDLSPDNYIETGIPFIRTSEIKEPMIRFSSTVFLSEETNEQNKKTELNSGDLVFTKIGAFIGDVAMLPNIYQKYNFSQNVAGASLKDKRLGPFLLSFFFSDKGRFQILRSAMISGQGKLELNDIRNYLIPDVSDKFKSSIAELIQLKEDALNQANEKYSISQNLLLSLLGLENMKFNEESINIKKLSESLEKFRRIDSEFYQKKYEEFSHIIESHPLGFTKIQDEFDLIKLASKKDHDEYLYVEISDINIGDGSISPNLVNTEDLPANAKIEAKQNDLIVSKVRPNRGAVAIVDFSDDNLIVSGAFTVLRKKPDSKFSCEILKVLLRTELYKEWLLQFNVGTSYPVINDEDILNLSIPKVDESTQKTISDLMHESFQLKIKSEQLFSYAKRAVEIAIEEDEEKALNYLVEAGK